MPAHMNHPTTSEPDQTAQARALCEKGLWPEVLAQAQKWYAKNPADAKAWFYQGVALAAMGRFIEAETRIGLGGSCF